MSIANAQQKHPWMPLYIADYVQDTLHLRTVEHGAYMLMIMHYWAKGNLPDNDIMLARIVRLPFEEWMEMRTVLSDLFQEGWKHKRIDAEIAKMVDVSIKRRNAALQMHSKCRANAEHKHPHTHTHTDTDTHTESKKDHIVDSEDFDILWKAYPRRGGSNPRALALRAFRGALGRGANPQSIIDGARRYAEGIRADGKERTSFVAQTATWLNQDRWNDEYVREKHLDRSGKQSLADAADDLKREFFGASPDNALGARSRQTPALLLPVNGGGRPEDLHFSGSSDAEPVHRPGDKSGDRSGEGSYIDESVVAFGRRGS